MSKRLFNEILKEYIYDHGHSTVMISDKIGCSVKKIQELLNGVRQIKMNDYFDICKAMNVHPSHIINQYMDSDKEY